MTTRKNIYINIEEPMGSLWLQACEAGIDLDLNYAKSVATQAYKDGLALLGEEAPEDAFDAAEFRASKQAPLCWHEELIKAKRKIFWLNDQAKALLSPIYGDEGEIVVLFNRTYESTDEDLFVLVQDFLNLLEAEESMLPIYKRA